MSFVEASVSVPQVVLGSEGNYSWSKLAGKPCRKQCSLTFQLLPEVCGKDVFEGVADGVRPNFLLHRAEQFTPRRSR